MTPPSGWRIPREPHDSARGLLNELKDLGFTQEEVYFMFSRRLLMHRKAMEEQPPDNYDPNHDLIDDALTDCLDVIIGYTSPHRRIWENVILIPEEEDPPAALYLHAYPKLAIEEDPEDKQ